MKKLKNDTENDDFAKNWKSKIALINKNEVINELPYPIDSLSSSYYNEKLLVYITKSGMEKLS